MKNSITSIKQSEIEEKWYLVDLDGKRIGTSASLIAQLLMGKNNPKVRSYHDPKVKVIAVNSDKLDYTTKRGFSKFFKRFSGYPNGLRFISLETQMKKDSKRVVEEVLKGMLPRTKMGKKILANNLKVYKDENHLHEAQNPEKIDLTNFKI